MSDTTLAATATHRAWPSLTQNKPLRFAAVMILYFMQGVPLGLSLIALPAWLAAEGVSPTEIGAFVAIAVLPWSLKLANGLLMDRFAYRPMGRRRAWILSAQAAMVLIFLALGISAPNAQQISFLAAFCFALNLCGTFNDVAVDGMVIDIVPEEERGAINGCMSGSQSVGIAATAYVGGQFLAGAGMAPLALVLAGLVCIASIFVGSLRERPGERLMPWSPGAPSPECDALQQDRWWPIVIGVLRGFASRSTLLFLVAFVLTAATYGFIEIASATLAVQQLGWGSDEYSSFAGAVSLIAGIAGIFLTGLVIKLIGLRNATAILLLVLAASLFAAMLFGSQPTDTAFSIIYSVQIFCLVLVGILFYAWSMHLSDPAVAASQFALFMAIPNFGRTASSGASGWVVESQGYAAGYLLFAVLVALAFLLAMVAGMGRVDHARRPR